MRISNSSGVVDKDGFWSDLSVGIRLGLEVPSTKFRITARNTLVDP